MFHAKAANTLMAIAKAAKEKATLYPQPLILKFQFSEKEQGLERETELVLRNCSGRSIKNIANTVHKRAVGGGGGRAEVLAGA
jgi:hypothetical protein